MFGSAKIAQKVYMRGLKRSKEVKVARSLFLQASVRSGLPGSKMWTEIVVFSFFGLVVLNNGFRQSVCF